MRYCKSKSYATQLTVISEEVYFEGDITNLDVQLKFCELIVSGYFLDSVVLFCYFFEKRLSKIHMSYTKISQLVLFLLIFSKIIIVLESNLHKFLT